VASSTNPSHDSLSNASSRLDFGILDLVFCQATCDLVYLGVFFLSDQVWVFTPNIKGDDEERLAKPEHSSLPKIGIKQSEGGDKVCSAKRERETDRAMRLPFCV
jgi:hypothetical protein